MSRARFLKGKGPLDPELFRVIEGCQLADCIGPSYTGGPTTSRKRPMYLPNLRRAR